MFRPLLAWFSLRIATAAAAIAGRQNVWIFDDKTFAALVIHEIYYRPAHVLDRDIVYQNPNPLCLEGCVRLARLVVQRHAVLQA